MIGAPVGMDHRIWLAGLLTIGFVGLVGMAMFAPITESAQRIVDGGIGALGVALGNAIAGIFRNDRADDQRAMNTGTALATIQTAIEATPAVPRGDARRDDAA